MSASDKEFNRLRAQFSRLANAPGIPALASKLCWWIAYGHMNTKRRSTYVSQITLASDLGGVTVRSVQRMIDVLKPLGLNVAPGHGPNTASTYWLGEPNTTSMSPIQAENTTPVSPIEDRKGDIWQQRRRHLTTEKATPVSPPLKKVTKKDTKERGFAARSVPVDSQSMTNSATADDATSSQRAPDGALDDHLATQNQPPSPERNETELGTAANGADAGRQAQFRDVKRLWPRVRVDEGKAFPAFLRVMAAGHSLQAVIDAVGQTLIASSDVPWLSEALAIIERGQARRRSGQ